MTTPSTITGNGDIGRSAGASTRGGVAGGVAAPGTAEAAEAAEAAFSARRASRALRARVMNPISVDGDVGVVVPDPESPESEASFRGLELRSFGGAEEEGGGDEAEAARGSSDAFSSSAAAAAAGAATERTRLSMRFKCAAGSDEDVSSSSIFVSLSPVSASIPDRASRVSRASAADAAASCAAFAGAQRHHTSPSAPSAKARAPRVAKSRGARVPFSCLFSSLSLPAEENGDGARGYHARTAALTTSTTAIAFSDEDKTHGPRAWSAPNSHFLGNFFLSARRLARRAEDAEPGDALASGTEGRTVASTFASESSPSVAARHTHSRRPGRAPNIQYTLFALSPAARFSFVFVSVSFSSEDGFGFFQPPPRRVARAFLRAPPRASIHARSRRTLRRAASRRWASS
jgi:hypothetical protein